MSGWGTSGGTPNPPWALLDYFPDEGQPLEEWLAQWAAKGVEPEYGPGVFMLNGRECHRYAMGPLRRNGSAPATD